MSDLLEKNNQAAEAYRADRRAFLKSGAFLTAALGFWTPSLAKAAMPSTARLLRLENVHTGEKFSGEYWYDGKYLPDAFRELKTFLRDYRNNEKFPIDPRLMDVLFVVQRRSGNQSPFHVYSGYRSPQTNAMLRRMDGGVARQSLHMQGQAIDVDLPGTRLSALRTMALNLRTGGVGYYPSSYFVHVDTGRVRSW